MTLCKRFENIAEAIFYRIYQAAWWIDKYSLEECAIWLNLRNMLYDYEV